MSSSIDKSDPRPDEFCRELKSRILSAGEPLRECFRRFEETFSGSTSRKKLLPVVLIEHTAAAALDHPESLALLLKAIEFMPVKHGPASILDGLLRLPRSEKRDQLLVEVAGMLEAPLPLDVMNRLANELKDDLAFFPARVWKSSSSRHDDAHWCRTWARFCQEVLFHLPGKSSRRGPEVREEILKLIEQVGTPSAEGLVPLVLFLLARDRGELTGPLLERLLNSAAGRLAQARLNVLPARNDGSAQSTVDDKQIAAHQSVPSEPVLRSQDFPSEPYLSLFRIWSSLGSCLLTSKVQCQKVSDLEVLNRELQATLEMIKQNAEKQKEGLRNLQAALDDERQRVALLNREHEAQCQRVEQARKEFDRCSQDLLTAREAYDRLDRQSEIEKSSRRDHVLTGLRLAYRQPCEDMAEIIEMALRGEKELADVARMWNRLDETLGRALDQDPIAPVKYP